MRRAWILSGLALGLAAVGPVSLLAVARAQEAPAPRAGAPAAPPNAPPPGPKAAPEQPLSPQSFGAWGVDLAGRNTGVKPGDDFNAYASGGYLDRLQIPADRTAYGIDYALLDTAEQQQRAILEQAAKPGDADQAKINAFYRAFMDEGRVNALGARPIAADLAAIRAVKTRDQLAALMGRSPKSFQSSVFDVGIGQDPKRPDRYAVGLSQGGLGLPDRDYYLTDAFKEKRAKYRDYIEAMLRLAGWPEPKSNADATLAFETRIAQASWPKADQRDPDKTYNPMSLAALARAAPGFAWAPFLKAADLGSTRTVIVSEKTAFPKLAANYAATPLPVLRAWAAFHVADSAAPYLSQPFVDARFEFRSKTLSGQQEQRARWKRAVAVVGGGMGEAVGREYVARHFPPDAKAKIDALVGNLKLALGRRIAALDWMSPATKAEAQAKLAAFTTKIGYPDKWRDYSRLQVRADDLAGDVERASAFEWDRQVRRLNQPVDRSEWQMTPQTVNAYYDSTMNEIVFPAAILQAPYFATSADPAVNYGAIGAIIGHEMTHGFDDEGRKFDAKGKLRDWWTAEDAKTFEARAAVLGKQYSSYEVFPGAHINGELTMGENIADLGGILVALDAYHASLNGQPAPVIDGLTGDQRFFLAYAQGWRNKRREDAVRQQLVADPHSPEAWRVNGVVRNLEPWYAAYEVKPVDKLFLAPADRARIW